VCAFLGRGSYCLAEASNPLDIKYCIILCIRNSSPVTSKACTSGSGACGCNVTDRDEEEEALAPFVRDDDDGPSSIVTSPSRSIAADAAPLDFCSTMLHTPTMLAQKFQLTQLVYAEE
jgi:hypothetical protein